MEYSFVENIILLSYNNKVNLLNVKYLKISWLPAYYTGIVKLFVHNIGTNILIIDNGYRIIGIKLIIYNNK